MEEKTEKGGVIRPVFEKSYDNVGGFVTFFTKYWKEKDSDKNKGGGQEDALPQVS